MNKCNIGRTKCKLGGDENSCEDCAYYPDYKFDEETGECEKNE